MCGIAGFWHDKASSEAPEEILGQMADALAHRGPDDSGVFHDEMAGLGLAFRRLAILDLSPEGHQPMLSRSGRLAIVFNGEVYNHEELKRELGSGPWRGHSDTEVMLEAIERWGVERAVRRFIGMFAFALWDRTERQLYLVRDRLGIKPLYYGRAGSAFVFASELKAIRRYPGFEGEIDRDALAAYLRHNYVPTPRCIYKGLCKLPPGSLLRMTSPDSEPEIRRYWPGEEVVLSGQRDLLNVSDETAVEQLHRLLLDSVRLRMIADVPLGAFLSGGVDSSTVVALMQAVSRRPVKTFTIGFHEAGYNEAADARAVAAHLQTEHTELYVTSRDALDVVPRLAEIYDEPFADSSQIPTFLVSRLARQSVTVSLSGDGGDELFGGYNRYVLTRRIWSLIRPIPKAFRKWAEAGFAAISPQKMDSGFRWQKSLLRGAAGDKVHKAAALLSSNSECDIYHRLLSHWKDPGEVVLGSNEPAILAGWIQRIAAQLPIEETMMAVDLLNYLPDDILTKVDRASMAVALEARVPLLDHRVVEFAWRLPRSAKMRRGTTKWLLRQILYKYVPPRLIERPKMGFGVPIGSWLRGPLREWAEALLSRKSLTEEGLFNPEPIREKWTEHIQGKRNWEYPLWDVLVFQDWLVRSGTARRAPVIGAPGHTLARLAAS